MQNSTPFKVPKWHWYEPNKYPSIDSVAVALSIVNGEYCLTAVRRELDGTFVKADGSNESTDVNKALCLAPLPEPPAEWVFGDTLDPYVTDLSGKIITRHSPRGWKYGHTEDLSEAGRAVAYVVSDGCYGYECIELDDKLGWTVVGQPNVKVDVNSIVCWISEPSMPDIKLNKLTNKYYLKQLEQFDMETQEQPIEEPFEESCER